jgi:hypothetical protein
MQTNSKLDLKWRRSIVAMLANLIIGNSALFLFFFRKEDLSTYFTVVLKYSSIAVLCFVFMVYGFNQLKRKTTFLQLVFSLMYVVVVASMGAGLVFWDWSGFIIGIVSAFSLWQWTLPLWLLNFFLLRWAF